MFSLRSPPFSQGKSSKQMCCVLRFVLTTGINICKPATCQVSGSSLKIGYIILFFFLKIGILTFLVTNRSKKVSTLRIICIFQRVFVSKLSLRFHFFFSLIHPECLWSEVNHKLSSLSWTPSSLFLAEKILN